MEVELLVTEDGRCPYREWIEGLDDPTTRKRVGARVNRLSAGNLGDASAVGGGVWELRMHFGPGYRVYIGRQGDTVVVLLCGGDKATQDADIETAKAYWRDHEERRRAQSQ